MPPPGEGRGLTPLSDQLCSGAKHWGEGGEREECHKHQPAMAITGAALSGSDYRDIIEPSPDALTSDQRGSLNL